MVNSGVRCIGVGFLALILGSLVGLVLGNAAILYGIAGTSLYLAVGMGSRESLTIGSAQAGMLTLVAPALAAGLPARWIAEGLFYNRYMTWWEQVQVSAFTFLLLMALGALAGSLGGALRRPTAKP